MTIGFTGTRHGLTSNQKTVLRRVLADTPGIDLLISGADPGADHDAFLLSTRFRQLFLPSTRESLAHVRRIHRPNDLYELITDKTQRNQTIVRRSHLLIACPAHHRLTRGGTTYTIRYAARTSVPFLIIWPSGQTSTRAPSTGPLAARADGSVLPQRRVAQLSAGGG